MSRLVVAIFVALALVSGLSASATPRTESKRYVAVGGDTTYWCDPPAVGHGMGGTCFNLPASATTARITVDDDLSSLVLGYYSFGNGWATLFCGETTISLPSWARSVGVMVTQVKAIRYQSAYCPGAEPATVGTVSVEID